MSTPQIELREAAALVPYARNSRTHSDHQVEQLAAALDEYGMVGAIIVRDGTIAKGHGTLQAITRIYKSGRSLYPAPGRHDGAAPYPAGMVPVIDCSGWSEARFRAYVIADNRLALDAGWDEELLKVELSALVDANFDVTLLGFNDKELAGLLAPPPAEGEGDPDAVPATPQLPASEPGDVWILGKHRLVCGDCTDADTVAKALNGVAPQLMVSDPPYGVNYDPDRRARGIEDGAKRSMGTVKNDDRADWSEAWALFPGDVAYVWHGMKTAGVVEESMRKVGFELRAQIVWRKASPAITPANINPKTMGYSPQHECAFYMVKPKAQTGWAGGRSQSTVWDIPHVKNETGHGTQKPVECMARPILNNSSPGQAVYDPFCGSGTTIIAGEQHGRAVHAIEIDPAYVDVAVTRWEQFSGQQARLEETGETFVQVLARRRPDAHVDAKKAKKG